MLDGAESLSSHYWDVAVAIAEFMPGEDETRPAEEGSKLCASDTIQRNNLGNKN